MSKPVVVSEIEHEHDRQAELVPEQRNQVFIARQPIFDRKLDVAFFELLHRSSPDQDAARFLNQEIATSELLVNSLIDIGLDRIAGDKLAFVNLTKNYLMGGWPLPLEPDQIGLELLATPAPDAAFVDSVRGYARRGFKIVLDDFIHAPQYEPLLAVVHAVKLDAMVLGEDGIRDQVAILENYPVEIVVKRIESRGQFERLKRLRCHYFQGHFASKPQIVAGQGVPTQASSTLSLLSEIQSPDVSLQRLEEIISQDVTLSYKLLRYINSAFFNLSREVGTIRQALVHLGLKGVRVWSSLLVVMDVGDQPTELKKVALIRAKFCEWLALSMAEDEPAMCFTVGLFSKLDDLLGTGMAEIVESLPLAEPVRTALLKREGVAGELLQCAIEHENAAWRIHDRLGLGPEDINAAYVRSVEWADELVRMS